MWKTTTWSTKKRLLIDVRDKKGANGATIGEKDFITVQNGVARRALPSDVIMGIATHDSKFWSTNETTTKKRQAYIPVIDGNTVQVKIWLGSPLSDADDLKHCDICQKLWHPQEECWQLFSFCDRIR